MDEASASVPFPVCSERVLETDIRRICVGRLGSTPSLDGVSLNRFAVTKKWDRTAEDDDSKGESKARRNFLDLARSVAIRY